MWILVKDRPPPKDIPYVAYIGDLCLVTPLGNQIHVTNSDQWQYEFKEDESIEICGNKMTHWLEIEDPKDKDD